jgi:hypothetical protein
MPFVLLAVLSAGAAVQHLTERHADRLTGQQASRPAERSTVQQGGRLPGWALIPAMLALPLVLLPDAPAVLRAPLTPVHYPRAWQQVAEQVRGSNRAVLVLPFGSYRGFGWAPGRTVLDPAPRWLPAETVVDDRLVVSGVTLGGEDPAAGRVAALLAAQPNAAALAEGLAGQGIGWVVRETDTPGPELPDLRGLQPVLTGGAVELYRVPGPVATVAQPAGRRWAVLGLDLLVAALVLAAFGLKAMSAGRRLLHSPVTSG